LNFTAFNVGPPIPVLDMNHVDSGTHDLPVVHSSYIFNVKST